MDWHIEALGVPSGQQSRAGDPRGLRSGRGSGCRSRTGGHSRLYCPSFSVLRVVPQTCLCGCRCLEPSPGLRSPPRPWSQRGWRPVRGHTPLSTARSARLAAGPLASCGRRWTRRRIRRYWAPERWGLLGAGGGSDVPHSLPPSPTVGRHVVAGVFGDHAACPCKAPGCPDTPGLARRFLGGPAWDLSPLFSSLLESATAACLADSRGVCVKAVLVLVVFSRSVWPSVGTGACAPLSVAHVSSPSFPSCRRLDSDLQSREE